MARAAATPEHNPPIGLVRGRRQLLEKEIHAGKCSFVAEQW
jgi:hypothetical protein